MTEQLATERACVIALARAARDAGTRQQVRAAARAFVRRHRRDHVYLRWVLRSVCRSAALAVVLLGFGAAPASAALPPFVAVTGSANPMDGQDVGTFSRLAFADLDRDGDLDVVAGGSDPVLSYFENTGSAIESLYVARTGTANPFDGAALALLPSPALGDLDGDGDLDALIGDGNGLFRYFENTGDATAPIFVARTGTANPMSAVDVGLQATPALGDLDGDGDLDLVVGEAAGQFFWYENTGTATGPVFVVRPSNPLSSADVGNHSTPALGDADGDGDLDLVSGSSGGSGFFTFENTGNARTPAFVARTGAANPLDGQVAGYNAAPRFSDFDGDGDPDLIAGEISGGFHAYRNRTVEFVARTGAADPFNAIVTSDPAGSALVDLDGDGDRDLILGTLSGGNFRYAQNTGSVSEPAFFGGAPNPLSGFDVGQAAMPAAGDLDGDGDFDVLAGSDLGTFSYFRNTGSAGAPAFVSAAGSANPLNGADVGTYSAPALGDLDGDGDLDLVSGRSFGAGPALEYYENTGSSTVPAFIARAGGANPFDGFVFAGSPYSLPAIGDVDDDGDLDVVVQGTFYLENTGISTAPAFVMREVVRNPLPELELFPTLGDLDGDGDLDLVGGDYLSTDVFYFEHLNRVIPPVTEFTGLQNPLNGFDIGSFATTALGDLDADGDLDLLAGEVSGAFFYFQNTGNAVAPKYIARTGTLNPLDGQTTGARSKPAFGDLDADADLDLVAGSSAGTFFYYENTGTVRVPAFVLRTGLENPLDGEDIGLSSAPALVDLDRDGDLDMVAGNDGGQFHYYENTGIPTSPEFVEHTDAANPLFGLVLDYNYASPAFSDIDEDGDLDLVSGDEYGGFSYYRNVGTASEPVFAAATGADNPFGLFDAGSMSAPMMGDLDHDGDPDLVTGRQQGSFSVHYLPEPARGILLGAGLALLAWLERLRRRGR